MSRPEPIQAPTASLQPSKPIFARATGREFKADATSIDIFDEIGFWGVSASEVRQSLMKASGDVTVRINSPGGDVFEGIGILNLLVQHEGHVRVEVIGLAASAASLIAMAGDEIVIADNAYMMVHRAWSVMAGNEADFADTSALLRSIDGSLAKTYASRTGRNERAIKQMMDDETWMTADEAVDAGFADSTMESKRAKAAFDLSVFAKVPEALRGEIDNHTYTIRDVESALREAGFSRSQARALAMHGHRGETEHLRDAADLADLAAHINAAAQSIIH